MTLGAPTVELQANPNPILLPSRAPPAPPTGFAAYLASNSAFYFSPLIRDQYAARNHGLTPTVALNDVVFAGHALVLTLVCTSQYLLPSLWSFLPAPGARPSRAILGIFFGSLLGILLILLRVIFSGGARPDVLPASQAALATSDQSGLVPGSLAWLEATGAAPATAARPAWVWLDAVYAVSYVKLLVTLVKYTPQVVANARARSTRGWSILQILLDLAGGVLSLAQLAVDSARQGDWSGVTGNPVKFALGNVSMVYDVIFIAQHYFLYPPSPEKGREEREGLLASVRTDEEGRIE